ncbi:phage virion morphogenesis protein [Ensifer sesbaniae]|uniref:phage virion morphogenesis protein n=1 Tax=Ensifer sesbaniae TaxID=1214071 RepID=UPI002001AF44|nr:phage virion morphogenesis protein [Ensifer sesbaniae]
MTGTTIRLDDTATEGLSRLVNTAVHPGQMLSAMGAYLLASTQRRFETETGPDGKKWKPLSKRTANRTVRRGRRRGTANILRVTTQLYQSLVMRSDEVSAEVGTNMVYAAVHQFGGGIQQYARSQRLSLKKIRGGRARFVKHGTTGAELRNVTIGEHTIDIPARPYLGFSRADVARLLEIGREHLLWEGTR